MLVDGLARVLHVCTLFSKSLSSAWDYTAHFAGVTYTVFAILAVEGGATKTDDDDDARRRMTAMTALHAMRLLVCGVAGRRTTIAMEELGRL